MNFIRLVLLIFLFSGYNSSAISIFTNRCFSSYIEITTTDITVYTEINASQLSVFGLYLNMKLEDIINEVNQHEFLYVEKDVFNENRLYLYDDKANNENNTLAYLILDESSLDLKEIVLYPNMIKYLHGNSKKLLTLEMINQNSDIVRYFSGNYSKKEKVIDIPSLNMESYEYFFPEKNFKLTKNKNDKKILLSLSLVRN